MSDELVLEHICAGEFSLVDVIFVHGLIGDSRKTWSNEAGNEFWPPWLNSDLGNVSIYTLGYPASLFEKRAQTEMDMFERAGNVLEHLAGTGIGDKPVVFVAHSLGGILTKLILRKSSEAEDEDWRRVSEATKLVIFLSTPHTGAALANVLTVLPRTSTHITLLANDTGFLEDLNGHYRTLANNREDLATAVYYEKHATNKLLVVVSRESADPGVAKVSPVPVDKDHINICKPAHKSDVVYLGIRRHIRNVVASLERATTSGADGGIRPEDYKERSAGDRRDLLQKLIDASREHEYGHANDYQNSFARQYTRTGLFTAAREDHDNLLSEIETRFVTHVYHPLICRSASDEEIRAGLQEDVIDPLSNKDVGGTRFNSKTILSGLYFLTEQCYIRWDAPK